MFKLWKILPYFILVRWIKSRSDMDFALLKITSFGAKKEYKGTIKQFDDGEYLFISDENELLQRKRELSSKLRAVENELEKYEVTVNVPET